MAEDDDLAVLAGKPEPGVVDKSSSNATYVGKAMDLLTRDAHAQHDLELVLRPLRLGSQLPLLRLELGDILALHRGGCTRLKDHFLLLGVVFELLPEHLDFVCQLVGADFDRQTRAVVALRPQDAATPHPHEAGSKLDLAEGEGITTTKNPTNSQNHKPYLQSYTCRVLKRNESRGRWWV